MEKEHFEILLEEITGKFQLVLEGHEVLRGEIRELARNTDERLDMLDFKIETVNKKIDTVEEKLTRRIDAVEEKLTGRIDAVEVKLDAVSADLSAHRADTEAHHGVYRVKES